MIPTPGIIVEYTLTTQDAEEVNRRREDARLSQQASRNTGAVVHVGNPAWAGDKYPLVITRAWYSTEDSPVNGQVLLDGNDTLWVSSRRQGPNPGQWRAYSRVPENA